VCSVERQNELFKQTSVLLPRWDSSKHLSFGDGYKGLQAMLHFDVLSLHGSTVPQPLMAQLKIGGQTRLIQLGDGSTNYDLVDSSKWLQFESTILI
jgi:protein-L-isoaspartate(D-aspartate) O-methyltransferase